MQLEKNDILIYFNDVIIGTTQSKITFVRESPDQKEYQFTNNISGLSAIIFADEINIINNEHVLVEIL
ncbi:MAG: hypothetical protein JXR69_03080 [Candidatus Delongbacteria bacterium]|nr:hypothetical protein [Candidatus Delongbacteria bacterium]